jgi:hypothetical protein
VPDHGGGGTEQETGVVDDVVGLAKAEEPEGEHGGPTDARRHLE